MTVGGGARRCCETCADGGACEIQWAINDSRGLDGETKPDAHTTGCSEWWKPPVVVGLERPDGTKVVAEFDSSVVDYFEQRIKETRKREGGGKG